jgi:hypothetical protein
MSTPLYSCMTKATSAEGDMLKRGPNWLLARRSRLSVFSDRLECGDWTIRNEEIEHAVLYSIRQSLFIPGFVLKIETQDKTYHFGLNYSSFWKEELPFPAARERGRLSHSPFSLAIGYMLWKSWN